MLPTFISLRRHHARRIGIIAVVVAAIILIKPVIGLFSPSDDSSAASASEDTQTAALAQATSVGLGDELPTDKNLPDIHVMSAMVKELGAAEPLLLYRPNARWPIASISKLLTAALAMDQLGAATIVTISQEAADTEGDSSAFKAGEKYSVNDLIRGMLVISSNKAAVALAQAYDRAQLGEEAYKTVLNKTALFTALLQQKARELGMADTYFGDPSGLSLINQSDVGDLAILMGYMSTMHPELLETTRQKEVSILERTKMARRKLTNINQFAGQKDFVGGKTGFTDEAGGNLMSLFQYEGRKYVIIVLGTEDRFGETTKLYDWLKQSN